MKYPLVIIFRYEKYKDVDIIFESNKDNLYCTFLLTSDYNDLYKLFNSYDILITYGDNEKEYYNDVYKVIADRFAKRWIHYSKINIDEFSHQVNCCYTHNVIRNRTDTRVTFSAFTTTYNSYEKIKRPFNSLISQTYLDWEWVIVDDSPNDDHFNYLREMINGSVHKPKIRLFRKSENSGVIGNVKNEAIGLCRGNYVFELDHDDEFTNDMFSDYLKVFKSDPEIGFIYSDFINIFENGEIFWYGDHISYGHAGYYFQYHNNKWVMVYNTANINNVTLRNLVSMPNHPRVWKRDFLYKLYSYSEFLPISDDYEILVKTALSDMKIAKIAKLHYIQYMNSNNNNFSLMRIDEIQRLVQEYLFPFFYNEISETMKKKNSYLEPDDDGSKIWNRKDYEDKYMNLLLNVDYKKQYCVLGLDTLNKNIHKIREICENKENDIILLEDKKLHSFNDIIISLNLLQLTTSNFKFMCMDNTYEELSKFFLLIYKSTKEYTLFF